jgi:triacylglycerol lipase
VRARILSRVAPFLLATPLLLGAAAPAPAARPVPADNPLSSSGPRLTTPVSLLQRSVACHGDVRHAGPTPVLLVHGTGSAPDESWGPVYDQLLTSRGIAYCTVALPSRATTDLQVSIEYVVHAIRQVSALRRGRIDVLGHSQGATLPVLAIKYWPDLLGLVEDYIGLAPTFGQGVTGEVQCAMPCTAPFQQRRAGSAFFQDVTAHPLPTSPQGASLTTIATLTDEIATPEPTASHLDGATNVILQESCPAKAVDHFGLLIDGTVAALVLDGLQHPGPVDPSRVPVTACLDQLPSGADPVTVLPAAARAVAADLQANAAATKLTAEPPVRCWVTPTCADADQRGRLLTRAVRDGRRLVLDVQAPGTLRVMGRSVPLRVGRQVVDLVSVPNGALRLTTTTSWYRVPALEQTLALPTVPPRQRPGIRPSNGGGTSLPSTGGGAGTSAAGLALLATAAAVVRRRRPV